MASPFKLISQSIESQIPDDDLRGMLGAALITKSNSQNFQDVWALYESGFKKSGMYIEFGATDGIAGSNTYMLEKDWLWHGALAEPLPVHHAALRRTRRNGFFGNDIFTECVWTESNQTLNFKVVDENDLSTIVGYGTDDEHADKRVDSTFIKVQTISLADLLKRVSYNLAVVLDWDSGNEQKEVDYLSVDTEGSEYDILAAYFANPEHLNYKINCITVEHNFVPSVRENLFKILTANGYERKFEEISMWDDFYKLKETK